MSMEIFYILVGDGVYLYEKSVISENVVFSVKEMVTGEKSKLFLDCIFVHYLMKELKHNDMYRKNFLKHQKNSLKGRECLEIVLKPTTRDLIDYNWNHRIYEMVREKSELDHIFSWLSTLGGAYSALGDYFQECAETAAKISVNQFKLALRLGDPQIAARCRLFLALSLIQRKNFRQARRIIFNEYHQALTAIVVDIRLLRMCKGIWAKLQYEHFLHVHHKRDTKVKVIKMK